MYSYCVVIGVYKDQRLYWTS